MIIYIYIAGRILQATRRRRRKVEEMDKMEMYVAAGQMMKTGSAEAKDEERNVQKTEAKEDNGSSKD